MKKLLFTLIIFLFAPTMASAIGFDSGYTYCRPITITAGGTSGGVATSTSAYIITATSTDATLRDDFRTTTHGGKIEVLDDTLSATSTPSDVIFTDGTDCQTDSGTQVDHYFQTYASTTGAFSVRFTSAIASTSPTGSENKALVYYGNSGASDTQDEEGLWATLSWIAGVWDLHEDPSGTAPQAYDGTSNSNDGTSEGTMTSADLVSGVIGNAIDFDGTDDAFSMGDPANGSLDFGTGGFSVAAWVQADGFSSKGSSLNTIVGKQPNGLVLGWGIYIQSDNKPKFNAMEADLANSAVGASAINDGAWHHLVGVKIENGVSQLYVDSTKQTDGASNNTSASNSQNFRIALDDNIFREWDGRIDEVIVYNKAIHAMDVLTDYNMTADNARFLSWGAAETEEAAGAPAVPSTGRVRIF